MKNFFRQTKELVAKEKFHTAQILKNLMIIERDKLYADLKYPSLFKYLIKELGYSEAESTIRVNAVRLMDKSSKAVKEITEGKLSLTNAAHANKVVTKAAHNSTRGFKRFIDIEFKKERQEILVLKEFILEKFDRLRKKYGDLSTYELLQIMLEKELKAPETMRRVRNCSPENFRSIPKSVKVQVYTGKCANCETKYHLEYDHIKKHSHGGLNSANNLQILCKSCNLRKEISSRMR